MDSKYPKMFLFCLRSDTELNILLIKRTRESFNSTSELRPRQWPQSLDHGDGGLRAGAFHLSQRYIMPKSNLSHSDGRTGAATKHESRVAITARDYSHSDWLSVLKKTLTSASHCAGVCSCFVRVPCETCTDT